MIWLFGLLIIIIAILEFIDEIVTKLDIKKFGIDVESNKIIKKLNEKEGEKGVFAYKLFSVIGFAIIGWFMYIADPVYFYILAGVIIALYFWVDIHNFRIFKKD